MEERIKFEYNGKNYSFKPSKLIEMVEFYNKMQLDSETYCCPLCQCDFADNNLFVCEECQELLSTDERCEDHHDSTDNICKSCCEECQEERAENDSIDAEFDLYRDLNE